MMIQKISFPMRLLHKKRTRIPHKYTFDSSLNESQITFAQHAYVQHLFTYLKCESLADFSFYYCCSDTLKQLSQLQLAEVVLNHQNFCMKKLGVGLNYL